jgi:hypothetical protein
MTNRNRFVGSLKGLQIRALAASTHHPKRRNRWPLSPVPDICGSCQCPRFLFAIYLIWKGAFFPWFFQLKRAYFEGKYSFGPGLSVRRILALAVPLYP